MNNKYEARRAQRDVYRAMVESQSEVLGCPLVWTAESIADSLDSKNLDNLIAMLQEQLSRKQAEEARELKELPY